MKQGSTFPGCIGWTIEKLKQLLLCYDEDYVFILVYNFSLRVLKKRWLLKIAFGFPYLKSTNWDWHTLSSFGIMQAMSLFTISG